MSIPDSAAINDAAAKLIGDSLPDAARQAGNQWELVERFALEPQRAHALLEDLIEILRRHLDLGLYGSDYALVLTLLVAQDATEEWLEHGGSTAKRLRLHEDGATLAGMVLDDHRCPDCAWLVLATALLSVRVAHATSLQRALADRREDGNGG